MNNFASNLCLKKTLNVPVTLYFEILQDEDFVVELWGNSHAWLWKTREPSTIITSISSLICCCLLQKPYYIRKMILRTQRDKVHVQHVNTLGMHNWQRKSLLRFKISVMQESLYGIMFILFTRVQATFINFEVHYKSTFS